MKNIRHTFYKSINSLLLLKRSAVSKQVFVIVLIGALEFSNVPVMTVYAQIEATHTDASESGEVVSGIPSQPLPIVDPGLKAAISETAGEALPTLDSGPAQASANIQPRIHLRNLIKKVFQAEEEVVAIVDNAQSEEINVSIKNHRGKNIHLSVREIVHGSTRIFKVLPPSRLEPGKYTLEMRGSNGESFEQDFVWGVLAINTNKSIYLPGETALLSFAVLNESGAMVCNADLTLQIQSSGKTDTLTSKDGKIKVNPECSVKDKVDKPDYEASYVVGKAGDYQMSLTAVTKNGTYAISDVFIVKDTVAFEVERLSATRIYPSKPYDVKIKVVAHEDFSGTISDVVPESFVITGQSGAPTSTSTESVLADSTKEVLGASVMKLGKPFEGERKTALGFAEQIDDPGLKKTYAQFGLSGHDGIDFDMPIGTPVLAVDDGTVTLAETADYGLTVVIQHSWGKSYYGHLSKISTPLGTIVTKGQQVASSGNSGLSTGSHLHFGIKLNEADTTNGYFGKIDPAPYIGLQEDTTSRDYAVKFLNWDVELKKGDKLELQYTYDAPDKSPQFYMLGPLAFHTRTDDGQTGSIAFQEARSWQIAVDATTHMLLYWDPANGSAPSGWSVVTTYDGRFIRGEGVANVLTTSGNATHTPTVSGSVTVNTGTSGRTAAGANTISSYGHTHSASVTVGAANNLPSFRSMQLIQYDAGIPTTIPANAIAIFDASPGMPGSGWTRVTAQDTRIVRVNSTVATGGSDTHNHSLTWAALGAGSGQITTGSNTNNQGASTTHTHTAPSATTSDTQSNLPPYVHVVLASANSSTSVPTGMNAMFDGQPSGSYSVQSESGGTFYQKFLRGNTAANAETTGGSSTHSHGLATSGVSGAASTNARGTSTAGTVAAGNGHTHTLSASFVASDDNTPEYVNMVIAEKIDVPDLTQIHSRWRNDDGSETTATWRRSEDTSATAGNSVNRRLRIEVSNRGTQNATSTTYRLEYGLNSTTCDAIATWTAVPTTATSEAFQLYNSSNLTDGNATTNVAGGLTDDNTTFVAGEVKDTSNTTAGISLTTTEFTEIEYSIQVTANPTAGEVYCFRLTNAGSTTNFTYSVYPQLTIGDPILDVKHYRWRNDDGGESALSGQTVSLLPTGQGANTGWTSTGCTENTAEYQCVDDNNTADSTNDGTTTSLATTTGGARSSFTLTDSQVPAGAIVSQVQIFMLGAEVSAAGGDATVTAFYNVGAGNVDCGSTSAFGGTAFTSQSCTFSGLSLSSTDVDNMEIGILFGNNDPTITKMYVTLTYDRSAASWKAAEDTSYSNQAQSSNIRLRLSIANTGDIAANRNFRLEYAAKVGASCGDDETFTTLPVTASFEAFEMTTSSYFTDGDATTAQLTSTGLGTFDAGKMVEDPSNSSGSVVATETRYSEYEFNFQANTNATGTYCFRVSDNGTALDAYTVYPELSITASGPSLGQLMRHGKWFNSSGVRQPFTF